MADRGIKIVKPGRSIESTDPDDYVYWSKHPTLQLLEKKTEDIVVGSGGCSGSRDVSHSYDFIPLVIATVEQVGSGDAGPFLMPAQDFGSLSCGMDMEPTTIFSYEVKSSVVRINYTAECYEPFMGGDIACPISNATFRIKMYFYMWKLGSAWPL